MEEGWRGQSICVVLLCHCRERGGGQKPKRREGKGKWFKWDPRWQGEHAKGRKGGSEEKSPSDFFHLTKKHIRSPGKGKGLRRGGGKESRHAR